MTGLELLAPARNADIGIAAIDCGADAVYIAAPAFGARKDAGNPVLEIERLCEYAHKFGVKIFVTFNIEVRDDELDSMHSLMLECQAAGADAFIIRDERICLWNDIKIPLHASTQCAIRTVERARRFADAGCARIVLERELSLAQIREICASVSCEVECFVHGALCVCYSGECRMSEYIDGRSADRGECIQACRSLYDLVDATGRTLVRGKALLSLKDLNLLPRLEDLADAGVMSFKIEGRLKNVSYVKNIVKAYSNALDILVAEHPDLYRRASSGRSVCHFVPDPDKTFNRGYTQLFLDGERGRWASLDAPKSMGEKVGVVDKLRTLPSGSLEITLAPSVRRIDLRNGDGFAFVSKNTIEGFRGDVCEGRTIQCKRVSGIHKGTVLFRNISTAFERELERDCHRELDVTLDVKIHGGFNIDIEAHCEDGRVAFSPFNADVETADNRERAEALIREGLGKRVDHFNCRVTGFSAGDKLPLLSASTVNAMRRAVVSDLAYPETTGTVTVENTVTGCVQETGCPASPHSMEPLMRSKYCIRYELGMCPVHQGAKDSGPLFLLNNGRRFALGFDCRKCEMTVSAVTPVQK